jgi:Flp pilus assembly protein TadG
MKNERGVVYVETLIGFLPVFLFFFGTLQLIDLSMAHLVVEHAASAAARAAVVVLPDDGLFYGDYANDHVNQFNGGRQQDVELAADIVLQANPRLQDSQTNVAICKDERPNDGKDNKCEKNPTFEGREPLTVLVSAPYRCFVPLFCPGGFTLKATAQLTYQGAPYVYSPDTNWAIGTIDRTKTRLQNPPDEPAPTAGKKKKPDPGDRKAPPATHKPDPDDGKVPLATHTRPTPGDEVATAPTPPSKRSPTGAAPAIVPAEPNTDSNGRVLPGSRRLLPVTNPTCFLAGTLVHTPRAACDTTADWHARTPVLSARARTLCAHE